MPNRTVFSKKRLLFLRTVCLCLTLVTAVSGCLSAAAAVSTDAYSWYTRPSKDNQRPPLPSEATGLAEHHAYALGKDEKVVYLTFDAGYENGNVAKIVDSLKRHDATGAFFILANIVETNPELINEMKDSGFLICNHSKNHPDMSSYADFRKFEAELVSMEDYFSEKMGYPLDKYFRPPEGRLSEQTLAWADEMGYKTILWSLAYADWDNDKQMEPRKALDLIMSRVHNGAIILLHPTSATNAAIMDDLLTRLSDEGYRFGSLDEL